MIKSKRKLFIIQKYIIYVNRYYKSDYKIIQKRKQLSSFSKKKFNKNFLHIRLILYKSIGFFCFERR